PEMTGRENIYLNGAILGMRRAEITRKFDEIVAFSGVERYIDTPVKRYSSGMYVRLAFAVAAHLESEILIVDEVLAVGDAEFQKKCLGKMGDVSKGEGRTVLFVSHNMAAVKTLCNNGIVLEKGKLIYTGSSDEAVNFYLSNSSKVKDISLKNRKDRRGNGKIIVTGIDFLNFKGEKVDQIISGEYVKMRFNIEKREFIDFSKLIMGVAIFDNQENRMSTFLSDEMGASLVKYSDKDYIDLTIPNFYLRGGNYDITFQISENSTKEEDFVDVLEMATELVVLSGDFWKSGKINRPGNFSMMPSSF
uniref:ABC transporter ATP-binding protein n=1 Tax=Flavobacterium sp. TaxID=239 RepID=UPI002638D52F